jgi:hypothetical protein
MSAGEFVSAWETFLQRLYVIGLEWIAASNSPLADELSQMWAKVFEFLLGAHLETVRKIVESIIEEGGDKTPLCEIVWEIEGWDPPDGVGSGDATKFALARSIKEAFERWLAAASTTAVSQEERDELLSYLKALNQLLCMLPCLLI